MVVTWCKKVERELWGLLEGGWEGTGFGAYRHTWTLQVRASHVSLHLQAHAQNAGSSCVSSAGAGSMKRCMLPWR